MRNRFRLLERVAAVAVIAGTGAACSSDVGRFGSGEPLFTGSTPNQRAIIDTPADTYGAPRADVTGSIDRRSDVARTDLPPAGPAPVYSPPPPPPTYSTAPPPAPVYAPPPARTVYADPPPAPVYAPPPPVARAEPPAAPAPSPVVAIPGKGTWTAAGGTPVTLREGETVAIVAARYGVPIEAVKSANGIADANAVRPGQQVVIPVYTAAAAATPPAPPPGPVRVIPTPSAPPRLPQRTAEIAPSALPDAKPRGAPPAPLGATPPSQPLAAHPTKGSTTHVVRKGETIGAIARLYHTDVASIRKANKLGSGTIRMGQTLVIPGRAPARTAEAPLEAPPTPSKTALAAPTVAAPAAPPTAPTPVRTVEVKAPAAATKPGPAPEAVKAADTPKLAVAHEAEPEQPRRATTDFRWPVRGRIISDFASRTNGERNDGIDIAVPEGTSVKAAEDGEVIYAGGDVKGFGNLVIVRHTDGYVSAYAHASAILVKKGEKVGRGQIIARSGTTGATTQPKLHFELRKDQRPVDPKPYLASN